MTEGTVWELGGVVLDEADIQWPLYRGSALRTVVVQQGGDRAAEFEALPYINQLTCTTSIEDGKAKPAHDTLTISGVRLVEVRRISVEVCELHLVDCRFDIAREVWPSDANISWRDGYLDGTALPELKDLIEAVAGESPILAANLSDDVIPSSETIEDNMLLSGGMMLAGLDRVCESIGFDYSVDLTGKLFFTARNAGGLEVVPTAGYNWALGLEPDWTTTTRTRKGLPKKVNVPYLQRHEIQLEPTNPTATVSANEVLRVELEQRYQRGEEYLTLDELADAFGISITDAEIARVYTSNNFDGTQAERDGSADAAEFITIVKRDWHKLWKVVYPSANGRRGGWSDLKFGALAFEDGKYRQDIVAKAVRAEWAAWFNVAEGEELDGAVLGRAYNSDTNAPTNEPDDAPFRVTWDSEADDMIRLSFDGSVDNVQTAWLGHAESDFTVYIGLESDDDGLTNVQKSGLHVPQADQVEFISRFDMRVTMVGTRRLPNTRERWTVVQVDAFPDGDLDSVDIEVSTEVYSLHRSTEAGEIGNVQNLAELQQDAERRVARYKERMAVELDGSATALGMELVKDFGRVFGPVREMNLRSDGVVVLSEISVGNLDNPQARYMRKRKRDEQRKVKVSGRVIA